MNSISPAAIDILAAFFFQNLNDDPDELIEYHQDDDPRRFSHDSQQ